MKLTDYWRPAAVTIATIAIPLALVGVTKFHEVNLFKRCGEIMTGQIPITQTTNKSSSDNFGQFDKAPTNTMSDFDGPARSDISGSQVDNNPNH